MYFRLYRPEVVKLLLAQVRVERTIDFRQRRNVHIRQIRDNVVHHRFGSKRIEPNCDKVRHSQPIARHRNRNQQQICMPQEKPSSQVTKIPVKRLKRRANERISIVTKEHKSERNKATVETKVESPIAKSKLQRAHVLCVD
eukprot:Opistho-2@47893